MKKFALWVSRHKPTPEQLIEIENLGFCTTYQNSHTWIPSVGEELGAANINTEADLAAFLGRLVRLTKDTNAHAIFGVFPTPVLSRAAHDLMAAVYRGDFIYPTVDLFAAWNISRTPEGSNKPTFAHKQFCLVGVLELRNN